MSKEPSCAKQYATPPPTETVVTGASNALDNVVVYVSAGAPDEAAPSQAVTFDQKGCRYIPHVLAFQTNQELKIVNNDQTSHNIHPLAKINHEWNKSQPPGTPPLSEKFEKEEFIPVKCNVHPWMHGNFAVLKNSHFSVSKDGAFDSCQSAGRKIHHHRLARVLRNANAGRHHFRQRDEECELRLQSEALLDRLSGHGANRVRAACSRTLGAVSKGAAFHRATIGKDQDARAGFFRL